MEIYFVVYIFAALIWGCIWGYATKTINENKGYDGGFWLGFFLGLIGLIIVLCKSDNRSRTVYENNSNDYLSSAARESDEKKMLSSGGWKCPKCGRINNSYTGTCPCGTDKSEVERLNRKAIEETKRIEAEKNKPDNEMENIEKIKSYKELLDSGVITQEEFDKKKAELLNL